SFIYARSAQFRRPQGPRFLDAPNCRDHRGYSAGRWCGHRFPGRCPAAGHPVCPGTVGHGANHPDGGPGQPRPAGRTAAAAAPQMLLISPAGLAFGPIPPSELVTGAPQWSADLMAGGTYIFIYAPTGQCLASVGPPRAPALAARRCDLGRSQRWRTAGTGIQTGGHYYGQFSNLASGRGLSAGGAMPSAGHGDSAAALAPCGPAQPWRQLISFWWAS